MFFLFSLFSYEEVNLEVNGEMQVECMGEEVRLYSGFNSGAALIYPPPPCPYIFIAGNVKLFEYPEYRRCV